MEDIRQMQLTDQNSARLISAHHPGSRQKGWLVAVAISSAGMLSLTLLLLALQQLDFQFEPSILLLLAVTTAVISLFPVIISMFIHVGQLDLFHPLAYAAWFFFVPHFTYRLYQNTT